MKKKNLFILKNNDVINDGVIEKFNRKNLRHVIAAKKKILEDALSMLKWLEIKLDNGGIISDCSTDINDCDNLETYWLDALFTNDELDVNVAKHDQLCFQVDKDGNWY